MVKAVEIMRVYGYGDDMMREDSQPLYLLAPLKFPFWPSERTRILVNEDEGDWWFSVSWPMYDEAFPPRVGKPSALGDFNCRASHENPLPLDVPGVEHSFRRSGCLRSRTIR